MSWGSYWMFYECPNCGTKYRWSLEELTDTRFGLCPNCDSESPLVAESKDLKHGEMEYYETFVVA